MDEPRLRLTTAEDVRARIAALLLGDIPSKVRVGAVSLEPHQISAVARIEGALEEFGGALLCDEVGMGKTFVAIAVSRKFKSRLIVAPAALAQMWRDALAATRISADFVSFEKLSRGVALEAGREHDLLIVDEAHHVRSRATRRYAALRQLARNSKALLLSATPIHNRRDDLLSLLSLFLGSRADRMTMPELARCTIRREHGHLGNGALLPTVLPVETLDISDNARVVSGLMNLPDPVPLRDGGTARTLVARGLVHQWASSEAALDQALRKRIASAIAMTASLEVGTYPTRKELTTWAFDGGALQLGFPEMLAESSPNAARLLECVIRHREALEAFRASQSSTFDLDAQRANLLLDIRDSRPSAKIVAFAQYGATVSMLFRRLAHRQGVGLLTSRGARVAGGRLPRREALSRFAPEALHARKPQIAERIDLLLSTDLLSEGVNLQDAEIVVHLDLPWTAARIEQRVGRIARMSSPHSVVRAYLFRPPASAAALLESEAIITRKWTIARQSVGTGRSPIADAAPAAGDSITRLTEDLRSCLETWRRPHSQNAETLIAAVSSPRQGFVAAVNLAGSTRLLVNLSGITSTAVAWQLPACRLAAGVDVDAGADDFHDALAQISVWRETELASTLAGTADSSSLNRRLLVARIDSAIDSAPPHSRALWMETASRARRVVATHHSAASEADLDALASSSLPAEEWLSAVARFDTRASPSPSGKTELTVYALLLLKTRLSE